MVHILSLLGLGLIVVSLKGMYPYFLAKGWWQASAKVVSISEAWADVPMRFGSLRYYFPRIEYEYEINGRVFRSHRVSFEEENIWQPEVNTWGDPNKKNAFFWSKWGNGTVIGIYVKPDTPSESVIVRDLNKKRRSHHIAIISGGMLITLLWGMLVYVSN